MKELRTIFVGIGSIAKRHIRNLRSVCDDRGIDLTVDAYRREAEEIEGVDRVFTDKDRVPSDYDAVFITNPTSMHLEAVRSFHEKGSHFFIEKPLVSVEQIDKAKRFKLREDTVYYVACPLRYDSVINWIKNNVDPKDVISVRCISSSYLPDWRPGQDYRKTYSTRKDLGGGVSIDLIHEWDYITYLFGWPVDVKSFIGKKSDLEINSDDYAVYIAEYEDKIAEIHLDYFGRKTIREIQLFTKDDTIVGDLVGNCITGLISGNRIEFGEERDDYQKRELEHFLDLIEGKANYEGDFWHGIKVLELTQGVLDNDN